MYMHSPWACYGRRLCFTRIYAYMYNALSDTHPSHRLSIFLAYYFPFVAKQVGSPSSSHAADTYCVVLKISSKEKATSAQPANQSSPTQGEAVAPRKIEPRSGRRSSTWAASQLESRPLVMFKGDLGNLQQPGVLTHGFALGMPLRFVLSNLPRSLRPASLAHAQWIEVVGQSDKARDVP